MEHVKFLLREPRKSFWVDLKDMFYTEPELNSLFMTICHYCPNLENCAWHSPGQFWIFVRKPAEINLVLDWFEARLPVKYIMLEETRNDPIEHELTREAWLAQS